MTVSKDKDTFPYVCIIYVQESVCVMASHISQGCGISLTPLVALRAAATADSAPSPSP